MKYDVVILGGAFSGASAANCSAMRGSLLAHFLITPLTTPSRFTGSLIAVDHANASFG